MKLKRYYRDSEVTLGMLFNENDEFLMFTLENPWKNNEVNISCVPLGEYECEPYTSKIHGQTYKLKNVKGRSGILFHVGNYAHNTEGCILLGLGADLPNKMLTYSADAKYLFMQGLNNRKFNLTITEL